METVKQGNRELTFLLVEDNLGHARLVEKNLRRCDIANPIVHVSDGRQALDYVFGAGERAGASRSDAVLVLLDINLPEVDGVQVLKQLKGDESTKQIPVLMLTTVDDEREIARCYEYGCNVYITKPVDCDEFAEAVRRLGLLLQVAKMPKGGGVS